jgi:hypothetical protein
VGSFDALVAEQQALACFSSSSSSSSSAVDIAIDCAQLLAEVRQQAKYRRRALKRGAGGRVLELWACLGCPASSKLSFKLQADVSRDPFARV